MTQKFSRTLTGSELVYNVREAIEFFTKNDSEFTPHQVTQQVRKQVGPTVEVEHGVVRDLVHKEMEHNDDYDSYLKDYGNAKAKTYRPITAGKVRKQKKKSPIMLGGVGTLSVSGPTSTSTTNTTNKGSDTLYVYPKSEGRVTIPASALKRIGVKPGAIVSLTKSNEYLTVFNDSGSFGHDRYTADKYGAIRVRKTRAAGFKRFSLKVDTKAGCKYVQLKGEK